MLNCFVDERFSTSPGVLRCKRNLGKYNSWVNKGIKKQSFTINLEFFELMIGQFLILFLLMYLSIKLGILFISEYSWESIRNFPVTQQHNVHAMQVNQSVHRESNFKFRPKNWFSNTDELLRLQLVNYVKCHFFLYFCKCFSFKQFLKLLFSFYLEFFGQSGIENEFPEGEFLL